jgi:hypothetical protein
MTSRYFDIMSDVLAIYIDDMKQYYESNFDESARQRVLVVQNRLGSLAKNLADEYSQLEKQYGEMK